MKGLLLKEWALYKSWLFVSTLMGIGAVLILPLILERYLLTSVSIYEMRIILLFFMLGISMINCVTQFRTSLHADYLKKDMWLHNSHKMYTLIGVKFLFSIVIYLVGNVIITTAGIYFLSEILVGSLLQLFVLQLLFLIFLLFAGVLVNIGWLFVWTLYLEGKYWIGKFSLITTVAISFLLVSLLSKLLSFLPLEKVLYQGEISLNFIEEHLPTFTTSDFNLDLGSVYIIEELLSWIIFVLLFWGICKWLERVVTR
ncbi:hypothetical protein KD050_03895 [Psychrobacillus sp. INOP01]|uniref:hypothetical protein n=1 Tax=Psychrobacillus sp. INOP01 TaxID=2829187 RepID=UPI001BACC729|nr:hypothetical protein [Psychrobacillus sp. INOP01]QUG42443.1 hypothetical protein KD050_03895 [Psychrobacillus sp. INOP01]